MDYFELEAAVETWAEKKGILANATTLDNVIKHRKKLMSYTLLL